MASSRRLSGAREKRKSRPPRAPPHTAHMHNARDAHATAEQPTRPHGAREGMGGSRPERPYGVHRIRPGAASERQPVRWPLGSQESCGAARAMPARATRLAARCAGGARRSRCPGCPRCGLLVRACGAS
eukprot:4672032-Prymnesium_polylepis.1